MKLPSPRIHPDTPKAPSSSVPTDIIGRFFEASPELHGILDAAGKVVRLNPAFERLLGFSSDELGGQDFTMLVHPEDREGSLTSVRRVTREHVAVTFQNRCRQRSGSYRWLTWHAAYDDEARLTFLSAHDITVYQSTSDILRRSEKRYRSLVSNLPGVVYRCTYDARWSTIYMSEGFEMLTGYPVVEFQGAGGRAFSSIVEPADVPLIQSTVRRAFELRSAFEVEYRIRHADGSVRWVYDKGIVVAEGDGWFLDGVMFDITERKRSEAQLRMLEAVVVNARDAVVVTDAEPIDAPGPTIVYVNDAFCRMTGFSREEVLGQTPRILHGPGTDRAALDAIREGLQRWEPVHVEVLNYRKDGVPFWSDISIVPVADETGWFTHWISVQRDVTERKHDEERLRVLEAAVGDATESVLVTDANLDLPGPQIIYANKGFEEMTGYTREEALGQTPRILQGPETNMDLVRGLREQLQRGERFFGETVNYRKDGTPFNIEWSISPVYDRSGAASHYVAVQRDVTDSRRYELEREARQRAEEMVRLRDAFLTNMSHEIRTPLTGIIGFAQILSDEVGATQKEFAVNILSNGERLLATLNGVLELARLQSLAAFDLAAVDVRTCVRSALDRYRPMIIAKGLTLEHDVARSFALANAAELSQLLSYLLDNAVKFTEQGTIRVRTERQHDAILITVADTGTGISEQFLPYVFDEFKQESDGLNRAYEGSGLGLTLAKRQTELMGGSLTVESQKGHGSRFCLTLPIAEVS